LPDLLPAGSGGAAWWDFAAHPTIAAAERFDPDVLMAVSRHFSATVIRQRSHLRGAPARHRPTLVRTDMLGTATSSPAWSRTRYRWPSAFSVPTWPRSSVLHRLSPARALGGCHPHAVMDGLMSIRHPARGRPHGLTRAASARDPRHHDCRIPRVCASFAAWC